MTTPTCCIGMAFEDFPILIMYALNSKKLKDVEGISSHPKSL